MAWFHVGCVCFWLATFASKGFLRVFQFPLSSNHYFPIPVIQSGIVWGESYCGFAIFNSFIHYLVICICLFIYESVSKDLSMDYNEVLLIPSIILQSVLLTSPTMKVTGQRILANPVAPPKSCLVEASGSIHGNIVGMRQMKRPRTIIAADISFLLVGIFFKRRNLEKGNDNSYR